MATLNFPTNPALNQTYTFGGKTWIWNGQGWQLASSGAINNIPIGNTTPAPGTFTVVTAVGNVVGNYFIGNGSQLTCITANYSNANVAAYLPYYSGNLPNLTGPVGTTGNLSGGNIVTAGKISATGNITGNYILGNGSQLTGIGAAYSNATAASFLANMGSNNISTTGNITASYLIGNGSAITGIVVEAGAAISNGDSNVRIGSANANVTVGVDGTPNVAVFTTTGVSVTGTVTATTFSGNGTQLTGVMADRGQDPNNWNTLTEMGVYTVNRVSWSGTVGTPLDSQVFVGLLEVKNSTDTAIEQIFFPGTVEENNQKIQWNRAQWNGSWTGWIKVVNDYQIVIGGEF